jgi:hypothetical protein
MNLAFTGTKFDPALTKLACRLPESTRDLNATSPPTTGCLVGLILKLDFFNSAVTELSGI